MVKLNISLPRDFLEPESKELIVSPRVKRHWALMLDLAAKFDAVCRKHNVRYALDSGSLLGAVRHGGFIPWDDDIDFIITRPEYEKLVAVAEKEFTYPYFFQTHESDREYITGHAKIRRSDTTQILTCHQYFGKNLYRFNQGVFLDLFVLDKVPNDIEARSRHLKKLCKLDDRMKTLSQDLAVAKNLKFFLLKPTAWFRTARCLIPLLLKFVLRIDSVDWLYEKIQIEAQKFNMSDCEYCAPIAYRPRRKAREFFRCRDMEDVCEMRFEFLSVLAPRNYDAILSAYYGDWHEHVVGSSLHATGMLDLDKSYLEYL